MIVTAERSAASISLGSKPTSASFEVPLNLWQAFWRSRDIAARNQLVERYEWLVHRTIQRLPANVRIAADQGDLYSFGVFGLIDAIEKCREHSDVERFPAYASYRIRGTIFDELRRLDWLPRSVRRSVIHYHDAVDELSTELRRTPRHEEVFASMNLDARGGWNVLRDVACAQVQRLPFQADAEQEHDPFGGVVEESCDPADRLLALERHDSLRAAIAQLTERQRTVIERRFSLGETQQQIAMALGVTTARVCQIEATAIHNLRRILGEGQFMLLWSDRSRAHDQGR